MRLTEQDILKRRQTIILTAFELFCERGIEYVTLQEIAQKSEVGEATIYRYFENKVNLVSEAFVLLWDTIMCNIEKTAESVANYDELTGIEQVSVWLETFRELYINNADFILFSYEAKLYLIRQKVKLDHTQQDVLMHAIKGPCLSAIEKGKRDCTISTCQNSEDLFYAIWGAVRGFVVKIVIYGRLCGEESPYRSRYTVLENGILSSLKNGWFDFMPQTK